MFIYLFGIIAHKDIIWGNCNISVGFVTWRAFVRGQVSILGLMIYCIDKTDNFGQLCCYSEVCALHVLCFEYVFKPPKVLVNYKILTSNVHHEENMFAQNFPMKPKGVVGRHRSDLGRSSGDRNSLESVTNC